MSPESRLDLLPHKTIGDYPNHSNKLTVSNFFQNFKPYDVKVKKVAKIRNRYNQATHLIEDTTWVSDKKIIKHHKREPRGHPFPSR